MERTPNLTYYNNSGALINKHRSQLALQQKVNYLEQEVKSLNKKLEECLTQLHLIQSSTNS